jgi:hypothetical protein
VQARTICSAAVVAASVACAAAKPHTFGTYPDLAPKVSGQQGERTPQHVTVDLARGANVAVFLVVPGNGSRLLYPADSTQSTHLDAGSHTVETAYAKLALSDSSRLIRRPNGQQPTGSRQPNRSGRGGFDPNGSGGINSARGYLLVYATQDSLPYKTLSTKVAGISIPIDDDDALNTVTKLIRETTGSRGTWAAYATEFNP